jgi:hypothetical protein
MDQTANPVTTIDSSGVREIGASLDRLRDCKLQAAMRSGMVVVVNVGPKHLKGAEKTSCLVMLPLGIHG